ncbi:hypothetical protein BGY98DRAFT_64594 [Russula aff. rugulosa BPL654]|nr:hypothetical protein BGY98DRAFT_64594 [Russula aff. rugulosa BPL654]
MAEQPRVRDEPPASQKRKRDNTAVAMAADLHTITRITQIWSDRLQLLSVYASFFTSIDSVLFSLASSKDKHTLTSKLMLASLVGALIFHAAAGRVQAESLFCQLTVLSTCSAILAYVASFVLIRYKLNIAESTTGSSESPITTVYAKYAPPGSTSVDKRKTPSALESGKSSSRRKVEHTHHHNTHASPSSSATPFLVGWPPLFSTFSHSLTTLLDDPPLLKIDCRRVSLFGSRGLLSCIAIPNGNPIADDEKNANALMRLLSRCHTVCTIFALSGFILVITGICVYLWAVLEHSVAIFGSACVGVCIILGLAALL